jgi:hypothetical protein
MMMNNYPPNYQNSMMMPSPQQQPTPGPPSGVMSPHPQQQGPQSNHMGNPDI